jgi:hypothetical protein
MKLFSSESSKSAREYLSADVIENPVFLLNLFLYNVEDYLKITL